MNTTHQTKEQKRDRRRARVRARIIGTAARPRLAVFRSLRGMYVQLIDDSAGVTLVNVHSKKEGNGIDAGERTGKEAVAYGLGKLLAEKATKANISTVVFDRGGYAYHGRVKAVADGARDGGLIF
ncbi:MAG: 50S ribosomal protein L18 [Candidatus Magasanikbacteria bacterium CG_4_9_14_0_2_um_filter_42_11]|uniref:Large ribosomal subunit protein uL18 n=1 Tax=Candidatus Magasanikbacteria bacterium CG_4_9_14_0_2_um_filter_42_11 TaxID=1974643 RepID=A0A2M8F8Q0_9BACT|nr:MAG: 50S ribosomal protein L18 [Candidatus Magasanikbacteria bacterium CG10_big_fil_rev_8_21_14_0_10_43_9]PJC52059.1 MAG: 50S ribosomal protein L18 [Candidatus Magasanikbacteria bacterium CG_4_9_14_0_2_um_filter_42_11]